MLISVILLNFSTLFKTVFQRKSFVLAGWLALSTTGFATPYTNLYVFGDSLSDTDNLFTVFILPPEYSPGRVSNGPVWIEYLSTQLGLAYTPETNFAWSGARTGVADEWGLLPGLLGQVDFCISDSPVDPKGLYILWIGANDLFKGLDDPSMTVTTAVSNISTALEQLSAYGVNHFLVLNVPDLGETPSAQGRNLPLTEISVAFNDALLERLNQLKLPLIYIDMFAFIHEVAANPPLFGLANTTEPCFNEANSPTVCENPDSYLFWDNKHPTTRAHQLIADRVYRLIAVPDYDLATQRLFIPAVSVTDMTGKVGTFAATLQFIENSVPLAFTLVEAQALVTHYSPSFSVTFNPESGIVSLPTLSVGDSFYRAKLRFTPETVGAQNFVVTELTIQ